MPFSRDSQLIFEKYVLLKEAKVTVEAILNVLADKNNKIAAKLLEMDKTPSKGHAIKLAKFLNEIKRIELVEFYYNKYLDLKKRNRMPKDITQYPTFQEFETEVDSLLSSVKTTQAEDVPENEAPVYEDANIRVHSGETRGRCMKFGKNYTFCVSRAGEGNLFMSHRLTQYMGALNPIYYFVFVKNRPKEDNKHIVVVGVGDRDTWNRTFADNQSEETTPEKLIQEVPELKPAFDKKVFKYIPLTEKEKEKMEYFDSLVRHFDPVKFDKLDYQDKVHFLQMGGFKLPYETWKKLNKELRNEYLRSLTVFHKEILKELSPGELKAFEDSMAQNIDPAGYQYLQYLENLPETSNKNDDDR